MNIKRFAAPIKCDIEAIKLALKKRNVEIEYTVDENEEYYVIEIVNGINNLSVYVLGVAVGLEIERVTQLEERNRNIERLNKIRELADNINK